MKAYSGNSQQKSSLFSSISPAERNHQPPLWLLLWCHQSQPEISDDSRFLMILFLPQLLEKTAEESSEDLTLSICFRFLKWADSKIFIMLNWLVYFLEDQHESTDCEISSICTQVIFPSHFQNEQKMWACQNRQVSFKERCDQIQPAIMSRNCLHYNSYQLRCTAHVGN